MGSKSKAAICSVLGHLIDELQTLRVVIQRLDGRLARRDEEHSEDIERLHLRVSKAERELRAAKANGPA